MRAGRGMLIVGLLLLSVGCWERGGGEQVGVITHMQKSGLFWKTWNVEMHVVGANNTIAADSWHFGLDASEKRGEDVQSLAKALLEAQAQGYRVRAFYTEEVFVAPWRSGPCDLIQRLEILEGK